MFRNARRSLAALGLLAVCSLAIPAAAQKSPGAPQALPVNVENTPNVNVANTPSVSVTNTPTVNVANSPTVTLESGASVAVTSPLDGQGNPAPIAVLDAVQPYEDNCSVSLQGYIISTCNFQTIPSGKMLVVQEFDAQTALDAGTKPATMAFFGQSQNIAHYFVTFYQGNVFGLDQYSIHQDTRLYVGEGQTPTCYVLLTAIQSSPLDALICNISGYLVDAPAGASGVTSPSQHQQHPRLPNGRSALPGRQSNAGGH